MAKINAEKWLSDKAAELGLDENELVVAKKLMNHNRFQGDFVPLPDFHSELDKQKTKYSEDLTKVVELNKEWQEAYDNEYGPALASLDKLKRSGFDVSGFRPTLDGDLTNRGGKVLTPEEIDSMIAAKLDPVRETTLAWGTFVADKSVEYRDTFGKRFDAAAFRKFGYDNREKYPSFDSAYEAFTAEDRKTKETADLEKWKEAEREKLRLELQSNMNFPEPGGDQGAPAFNMPADPKEELSDDAARKAFASKFADLKITT